MQIVLTDPRFHGRVTSGMLPEDIEPNEVGLHILAFADQIGRPGETVIVREWHLTPGGSYRAVLKAHRTHPEPGYLEHRVYVQEQN